MHFQRVFKAIVGWEWRLFQPVIEIEVSLCQCQRIDGLNKQTGQDASG